MTNKGKRILSIAMVVIGVFTFIGIIASRVVYGTHYETWQYMAPLMWICLFAARYRNFSQAVKEDEKYGPIK